ncbi:MAG: radical SAM protein [archaeon]
MEKKDGEIQKKYGNLKIVWQHEKLDSLRKGEIIAPVCVRIKPTNKCNHRCFYCSYDPNAETQNVLSHGFNQNDEIPREKMMEILDDFKEIGVKALTFSGGGEPLIYPHIVETLRKTLDNRIDLSIITNGQMLNGEIAELLAKAKWVRISLDACNEETFTEIRKVSKRLFQELSENIKKFSEIKDDKCELGINFVVNHLNTNQVFEAAVYFKSLGVNHVKFTPRWIDQEGEWEKYHQPFKESVISQIKRAKQELEDEKFKIFDTYENDFRLTGIPERTYSFCPIMQIVPVIGADSVVYFCHDKTYLEKGAIGSLKDQSFKDLWFSNEAKELFKNFNPKVECQQHCSYDARNIAIMNMLDNYGDHINFP